MNVIIIEKQWDDFKSWCRENGKKYSDGKALSKYVHEHLR